MSTTDSKVEQGAEEVVSERRPRASRTPRYTNKWTDADITERGVAGKVVTFVCRDGLGTISRGDDTLSVHMSNIAKPNPDHLVATLTEDEEVQFDIVKQDDKLEAVNVTGPKGKAVQGNEAAPAKGVATAPRWAIQFIAAIDQPTRHYGKKRVNTESREETDEQEVETEWTAKWVDDDIVERGVLGTIKWFQMIRGFGFVARDEAGETPDLFVHRTSVLKPNPNHIIETLADDERIKFDIVKTEKGQEAINVTGPDGGPVTGANYAPVVGIGYVPQWAFDMLSHYRPRNGNGRHYRRSGPRVQRRREEGTPEEGRKRRSGHRKPRKAKTETAAGDVTDLAEGVEGVAIEA